MDTVKVTRRKLSDYRPDARNANTGSERGQYMLDKSVGEVGAARSLVSTADDVINIGNHALQAFADAGLEDIIEIETDGRTPVIVKRTDWATPEHPQARKAAYYDNRSAQVSITFDPAVILEDAANGVDLSAMFYESELEDLANAALADAAQDSAAYALDAIADQGHTAPARLRENAQFPLSIVLSVQDRRRWEAYKEQVGFKGDTPAFLRLLETAESA